MSKRDELRRDENVGRMGVAGALGALATLAVSAGIAVIQNASKTKAEQTRNENTGRGNLDALTMAMLLLLSQNANKRK